MIKATRNMLTGFVTIGLVVAGVGIGFLFGALILGLTRNLTLISIIELLLVVVLVLLTVALVIVEERKTMASIQKRLVSNNVGYYGIFRAFVKPLKHISDKLRLNLAILSMTPPKPHAFASLPVQSKIGDILIISLTTSILCFIPLRSISLQVMPFYLIPFIITLISLVGYLCISVAKENFSPTRWDYFKAISFSLIVFVIVTATHDWTIGFLLSVFSPVTTALKDILSTGFTLSPITPVGSGSSESLGVGRASKPSIFEGLVHKASTGQPFGIGNTQVNPNPQANQGSSSPASSSDDDQSHPTFIQTNPITADQSLLTIAKNTSGFGNLLKAECDKIISQHNLNYDNTPENLRHSVPESIRLSELRDRLAVNPAVDRPAFDSIMTSFCKNYRGDEPVINNFIRSYMSNRNNELVVYSTAPKSPIKSIIIDKLISMHGLY